MKTLHSFIIVSSLLLTSLIVSCGNQELDEEVSTEKSTDEIIQENLGNTLEFEDMPDTMQVAHMVRVWNGFHTKKHIDKLEELYASQMFFYGKDRYRYEALDVKKKIFSKYPDYFQRISGTIRVKKTGFNTYKAEFTKYIKVSNITSTVFSYLEFQKVGENQWIIIAESDPNTDVKVKELADSLQVLHETYTPSSTEIRGRFHSSTIDTIYIFPDESSCNNCVTSLFFSNENLPPLDLEGVATAQLFNEGDLDGDGREEFSTLTLEQGKGWITIYTYKRGSWNQLKKFEVNYSHIAQDAEARRNVVQLAGAGYIYIEKWIGDTTAQEKVSVWEY